MVHPNYKILTEYLNPDDKALLATSMETTPPLLEELTQQLVSGEWQTLFPSCDHTAFPIQALKLFNEGRITAMQWSTSQLFFNVYQWHDPATIRFIPLFPNGKQGSLATDMINATMKVAFSALINHLITLKSKDIPVDRGAKHWNLKQEKEFYSHLWKHYPPSEHCFMLVSENARTEEASAADHLAFRVGFNMLSRLSVNKKPAQMIPSRGMMQALVEVRTQNPPQPFYRIGASPTYGLHEALRRNARDLYQTFAPLRHLSMVRVDGFIANPAYAEAEYHDFYHQMMLAHVPYPHRLLFIDFVDAIKAFIDCEIESFPVVETFLGIMVDMEFNLYFTANSPNEYDDIFVKALNRHPFTQESFFWLSIGDCFTRALNVHNLPADTTNEPFFRFLAKRCIEHHEVLSSNCQSVADQLISNEKPLFLDRKFNFYLDLRYAVKIELRALLLEKLAEDCEELTELNAYLRTAPDTFVKSYFYWQVRNYS